MKVARLAEEQAMGSDAEKQQRKEKEMEEEQEKERRREEKALQEFLLATAPEGFICPISLCLFTQPVLASDGRAYDRPSLVAWAETCQSTGHPFASPVTGEAMDFHAVLPNFHLKALVDEFVEGKTREWQQMQMQKQMQSRVKAE